MGIRYGVSLGRGHCPVNQNAWRDVPALKWKVYEELDSVRNALGGLENAVLVCALPLPYGVEEENIAVLRDGEITFGAPKDIAGILLRRMLERSELRCLLIHDGEHVFGTSPREVVKKVGL